MNVLLTGGSGKIGGYVLRALLSNGHVVTNYSRTPPFVQGVPHIKATSRIWMRYGRRAGDGMPLCISLLCRGQA